MSAKAEIPTEHQRLQKLIRNCLWFSLFWHLVAAWFSVGYHQSDEHFQILEFASWKLGHTPVATLPWEFAQRIRPALQPDIVILFHRYLVPWADPFQLDFFLRLFSALLGFGSLLVVLRISLPMVETEASKRFLVLCTTLLWFLPYIHAHFSAESMSGSLFFLGFGAVYLGHKNNRAKWLIAGGFLLGLSFICRLQVALMIAGLAAWCIFMACMKPGRLLLIILPFLLALGIGALIDRWFYGEWVFTAWNYFKVNIIEGKASEFGTTPWYQYFTWNFSDLIPPFSLFIMAAVIYSTIRYRANVFSFIAIPFLLGHIIISHKEPRFLFPIVLALPLLLTFAWQDWKIRRPKFRRILLIVFFAANIIMMAISSLKPASDRVGLFEYLYDHYQNRNATVMCQDDNPYEIGVLHIYYFRPVGINFHPKSTDAQIDSALQSHGSPVLVLFDRQKPAADFARTHPQAKLLYQSIPAWLQKFNFFHWVDRTKISILYGRE